MIENIFKYTRPNITKLREYGFVQDGNCYRFETSILNNQFTMYVSVDENGDVSAKLIDVEMQEEYVLHLMERNVGEFVGKVRTEFKKALTDIRDKCFEKEIFKSKQSKQVIEYIRTKYGDELEHLWEKAPTNAIWRRKDNNKWYALLIVLSRRKLGVNSDELVEIMDLLIAPDELAKVVDNVSIFTAYHMNKKSWFTICLDGTVPTQRIFDFIDKSYILALKKK